MIPSSRPWTGRPRRGKQRRNTTMGARKDARYGMPAHVHVVHAKGREYFYFQQDRGRPGEGPRVKLPGNPYDHAGTPAAEWWDEYRRLGGVSGQDKPPGTFAALIA